MKHFMPRNVILREHSFDALPPSPSSMKQYKSSARKPKSNKENAPPSDIDALPDSSPSPSFTGKSTPSVASKLKAPLPPRPPPSNPLKRKLGTEYHPENGVSGSSDTGVKVIVRIRPLSKNEEGEMMVQKTSGDSLSILGQQFTFDSVADASSTQMDIFQLVGAPLVENCLAGFNGSIFAYGQTGSGKTYTIWGPASTLLEENSSSSEQGLTPRVFERLFSRINEEQAKHADKQLIYQCRCSFLEIYNEQITDLLNPSQRNLHLREDTKTGVYVENLTEESIFNMKDVTHLLKKGLSNRRTGATSINLESSRSHSVFTCVVESRCKSVDGLSCFKTSRMNLVDLAGSERQKSTGATGSRLKEAGNINRSLSQLGNLINILAEVSQTGKQRHIPYRDSKLTFLLQESLGGNAKLAMLCAVSPSQSCRSETLSTLRFAKRAKTIKNKAVVNEQVQDNVDTLREVIRQLKDELLRMKTAGSQANPGAGFSTGWNARRSLNLLKFSLNHPMILPHVDDDGDEEMEIVEEGEQALIPGNKKNSNVDQKDSNVIMEEDMSAQVGNLETVKEKTRSPLSLGNDSIPKITSEPSDVDMEDYTSEKVGHLDGTIVCSVETNKEATRSPISKTSELGCSDVTEEPSKVSPIPKSPTPSVSPITNSTSRKSLRTSSMLTASQNNLREVTVSEPLENPCPKPSIQTSLNARSPSDHLASSRHHGLEAIDKHRKSKSSALGRSLFRSSYKPVDSKPEFKLKDVGVQALVQSSELKEEKPVAFLCRNCNCASSPEVKDSSLQLVSTDNSKQLVPKAAEKVLAGAIRREMALEELCMRQDSEISQLNRLLEQYKHERECNLIIGQIREDKITRLEGLMDGILSAEEFKADELASISYENKILKENYENHPEVLRTEIEFKRVQDELERYQNFFDLGEREVLLEEVQDLRNQLKCYIDQKRTPVLQLTYPSNPAADPTLESERLHWSDIETKWVSIVEDLKRELEASCLLVEKQKQELNTQRKCSNELKEAMQMAMESHAKMLEEYADLEEKHVSLLTMQRRIEDGVSDVKKAAAKAGVRGAESKFIHALAEEISTLKAEREKEKRQLVDENKGLRAQLKDTAEAVQAASELLVRLKEAEEAVAVAEARAKDAEREKDRAYEEVQSLRRKHEGELTELPEPSTWFSGYDKCNI